jgi:hypothetical protein
VQLALGEETGEVVPPFLGQDYTVVSGLRPVRPVSLPPHRADAPVPTLSAPITESASALSSTPITESASALSSAPVEATASAVSAQAGTAATAATATA